MIRVQPKGQPKGFNKRVRHPGLKSLRQKGTATSGPLPPKTKIKAMWNGWGLKQLYKRYGGICAYSSIRLGPLSDADANGAATVDHFIPKSKAVEHAYRWSNYRLASPKMNRRKREFDDVLDPFTLPDGTFELDLFDGEINIGATCDPAIIPLAKSTRKRLKLNQSVYKKARWDFIQRCLDGRLAPSELLKECPFVYYEMQRQNALPVPQTHAPTSP